MKFISFNINGLRARLHQLAAIIEKHQPDVIGLQETKVHDDVFPLDALKQFGFYVSYFGQKGHYGVALLTKKPPLNIRYGFPAESIDAQRRIIMLDLKTSLGKLTVINGYFPQGESREHPTKFPAKEKFYQDIYAYLAKNKNAQQPLIIMGDMNISPTDMDIGIGEENRQRWLRKGKTSFLPEERVWMQKLVDWGLIDTFRQQHPVVLDQFSWFDYRSRGFDENRGLRIDLILATSVLAERCKDTGIDYAIRSMEKPSDHAPIWAEFSI